MKYLKRALLVWFIAIPVITLLSSGTAYLHLKNEIGSHSSLDDQSAALDVIYVQALMMSGLLAIFAIAHTILEKSSTYSQLKVLVDRIRLRLPSLGQSEMKPEIKEIDDAITEAIRQAELDAKEIIKAKYRDQETGLANEHCIDQYIKERQDSNSDSKLTVALIEFELTSRQTGSKKDGSVSAERLRHAINSVKEKHLSNVEIGRIQGSLFVLLIETPPHASFETPINRIRSALSKSVLNDGENLVPSIVIGAHNPSINETLTQIQDRTKMALAYAKAYNESEYTLYNENVESEMLKDKQLEIDINKALKNNEFYMVYQPKVDVSNPDRFDSEALLRWENPVRGNVSPAEFIEFAETSGQIGEIGLWVAEAVIRNAVEMRKSGITSFRISFNVSICQLADSVFYRKVSELLRSTRLPPEHIEIEVTETATSNRSDFTHSILSKFRTLGVKVSLDDFGTGYSSLAYFRDLPLDIVKIDRSFVSNINSKSQNKEILQAMQTLIQAAGYEMIVEGVETSEELEYLTSIGANKFQGYFFSKPLRKESYMEYIDSKTSVLKNKNERVA